MEPFDTIILLSGGLDSAVILAEAVAEGKKVLALSFDYCQRHRQELNFAKRQVHHYGVKHLILKIDPHSFGQSSLVTHKEVPKNRDAQAIISGGICSTYVPARNTLFLAYAIGQAELHEAKEILYGPNALDKHCFPDCDQDYIDAMQAVINQTMCKTIPVLRAPLVQMDKIQIARRALELGVPIEKTLSCYDPKPDGTHCGACDSCVIRQEALETVQAEALSLARSL